MQNISSSSLQSFKVISSNKEIHFVSCVLRLILMLIYDCFCKIPVLRQKLVYFKKLLLQFRNRFRQSSIKMMFYLHLQVLLDPWISQSWHQTQLHLSQVNTVSELRDMTTMPNAKTYNSIEERITNFQVPSFPSVWNTLLSQCNELQLQHSV